MVENKAKNAPESQAVSNAIAILLELARERRERQAEQEARRRLPAEDSQKPAGDGSIPLPYQRGEKSRSPDTTEHTTEQGERT